MLEVGGLGLEKRQYCPSGLSTLGYYLLNEIFLVHLLFLLCYAQWRSGTEGAIFWSFTCILRENTFAAVICHCINLCPQPKRDRSCKLAFCDL